MKLAGGLLLASCALLSTLCVANARSIMAVNQQDDYEAVLQDLSMALKQQEDDDGNKMAKEQFLPLLAASLLPSVIGGVSKLFKRGGQTALMQQDDMDYQEAQLQSLYDSLVSMQDDEEGDDDGQKMAKEQIWGTLASLAIPALGSLFGGQEELAALQQDDDYEASLQEAFKAMAKLQQDDEGDDDGQKMAKEQIWGSLARLALPALGSLFGGQEELAALQQDDDYEASLQEAFKAMAKLQQDDEGDDDGQKMAKEQIWGSLARLALPALGSLFGGQEELAALQQDDSDEDGLAREQIFDILKRLPIVGHFFGGRNIVAALQQDDDYEASLQEAFKAMAKLQQDDEDDEDGVAKEQFFKSLLKLGKKALPHVLGGLVGGGSYYNAVEQQDGDYEARFQNLYDSQVINQEEDDDDMDDKDYKKAEMQFFKKFGRSLKKFGRKAGRGLKRAGKGALKHGGPIAGHALGGALAGALTGGGGSPSYYGQYN